MKFNLKIAVIGAIAMLGVSALAGPSIQRYPPQSTLPYAIYAIQTPGTTNGLTGTIALGFPNPYYPQYFAAGVDFTVKSNFYGFSYNTNFIPPFGLPALGETNKQWGYISTGTSNLLAGTVFSGVTGITNTTGGDLQVSWAGQYTNVTLNGAPYLLCTNAAGNIVLQPNEFVNWTNETILKAATKPF